MVIKEGEIIGGRYRIQQFMKRGNASELWQAFDDILRLSMITPSKMNLPSKFSATSAHQPMKTSYKNSANQRT